MQKNILKKEYLAILENIPSPLFGTISAPIARKEGSIIERGINPNGDLAITHFELITSFAKNNQELSLTRFILETGRTHQIRLHSKHIGHPILGDGKYGINEINKKHNKKIQELTAYKLIFNFKTDAKFLNYLNKKTFEI